MKPNTVAQLYTGTGYPFTAYGKRGRSLILIEWEWGDEWIRLPLWQAVKFPDLALGLAAARELKK